MRSGRLGLGPGRHLALQPRERLLAGLDGLGRREARLELFDIDARPHDVGHHQRDPRDVADGDAHAGAALVPRRGRRDRTAHDTSPANTAPTPPPRAAATIPTIRPMAPMMTMPTTSGRTPGSIPVNTF